MRISAYIIINLFLLSSWYAFLFRKKGNLPFADRLLGAFVLSLTQIIATEMLLGVVFRKLFAGPLFILNMLISSCLLFFSASRGELKGLFREIKEESVRTLKTVAGDKILLCIFLLFFVTVCRLIFLGHLFPSYTWDALYYHLPTVGQIMQSGAIQENPTPSFIQQYINIFGKNINLFFIWNVIFLKSDVIVDLSQLFFTLAGVLTIYSISLKLKIKEKYAIYSSLLFFFTPILLLQSTANYVDAAVSVLLLIAVNFLMYDDIEHSMDNKEGKTPIIVSGLAAGILLGSKPTGPLFIFVICGAIIIRELVKRFVNKDKRYSLKRGFKSYLPYFILPVILTGGYWYIRNWIYYGNPVYYMDVSIFKVTLLKGLKKDWVEPAPEIINSLNYLTRLFHVWVEKVKYYLYDSIESGFGPIWFIISLPCIVFSILYAVMKKKYSFLFISLILIVTFLVHPRNWNTRYVIFITGLGAVSFGQALDYFEKRENFLKGIALILAAYTFFTANSPCITPGKIKEFLALPAHERTLSRLKPFNIDILVRKEYGYWMWIENNVSGGDTLAYTFETDVLDTSKPFFTAPLWNREFSNRVVYVKSGSYNEWLKALEDNNAAYVLIKTDSEEDMWIEKIKKISWLGVQERFRTVYSDSKYKVLKFQDIK